MNSYVIGAVRDEVTGRRVGRASGPEQVLNGVAPR